MSTPTLAPELQQRVNTIAESLGVNPELYLQHLIIREWVVHRRRQWQPPMSGRLPPDPGLEPYQPYDYEGALAALEGAPSGVVAFLEEG